MSEEECAQPPCSAAASDSTLASKPQAAKSSGRANPTPPAAPSSESSVPVSLSSTTCGSSTPELQGLIYSLADSLASPFPPLANGSRRPTSGGCGRSSSDAFAFFDRGSCSWRTCQGSLLPDSETLSPAWPARVTWDTAFAYELPTLALPTVESVSSSLLPTPGAYESTPTEEYVQETVEAGIAPGERLYLPGRKWHAQRTLSRIAPALFPTPTATDAKGGRRSTARKEDWTSHEGVTLTDAMKDLRLLPTPMANPDNPGAGGELRAALTHGPGRRNETGTDTMGRPNRGRTPKLLPTPMASDGEKGGRNQRFGTGGPALSSALNTASTQTLSSSGNDSSGPLPDQPTSEVA